MSVPNHPDAVDAATAEQMADTSPVDQMIRLTREVFARYDEFWIVGHKGDHPNTLREMGVFDGDGPYLAVAHVHSTLDVRAESIIKPPPHSSSSYEGYLGAVNPAVAKHVGRAALAKANVCVFMPFPNAGLSTMVAERGAGSNFNLTAPVDDPETFLRIENKIGFAQLMDRALASSPPSSSRLLQNVIPWSTLEAETTFIDLTDRFELTPGQAVYVQKDLSAGGDGTRRIDSQAKLDTLMQEADWRQFAASGRLKVTAEIEHAYPANGSACIVPTGNGECIVLVDPLSHKPVGLPELGAKEGSGVGNDWSVPWPREVNSQYIELATLLGQQLYREFGYTGQFGPDCLVQSVPGSPGQYRLRVNEINPRWQGTTPYQTYNALSAGRVPLELVHYCLKLDDGSRLSRTLELIGDPNEYNARSVESPGCFYVKIGGPKRRQRVTHDMNGHYVYANGDLYGPFDDISGKDVATGQIGSSPASQVAAALRAQGKQPNVVTVKAPAQGEVVGGELAPIGYIVGMSEQPVFEPDRPAITAHGQAMFDTIKHAMFER